MGDFWKTFSVMTAIFHNGKECIIGKMGEICISDSHFPLTACFTELLWCVHFLLREWKMHKYIMKMLTIADLILIQSKESIQLYSTIKNKIKYQQDVLLGFVGANVIFVWNAKKKSQIINYMFWKNITRLIIFLNSLILN